LRYPATAGTFGGMTRAPRRVLTVVVALVLGVVGLGCGFVNQAKNVIDTAAILGDFADRLGRSATLTYTAEYQVTGGEKVTLAQDPPNVAFVSKTGRFILTANHMIMCDTAGGQTTCQRAPNQATQTEAPTDAATAGLVAGVAGPGFVTPELALGMVAAAALAPGAKVDSSERNFAGERSLCADVTGLENASQGSDSLKDFSVCVTELGILASFSGTLASGQRGSIELTSYRDSVEANAFAAPEGAKVTDVATLEK